MNVNSHGVYKFGLSHSTNIEHTRVPARECQLRCELYRTRWFDVGAVEFSSVVCVVLCSLALYDFSANMRSFLANLHAFASATSLLSLLPLLRLS